MSGHSDFYTPVEIIKEKKVDMDEDEKMLSEINDLFGITETSEDVTDTNVGDNTDPTDAPTDPGTDTSDDKAADPAPDTNADPEKDAGQKSPEDTPVNPEEKFNNKANSAFAQLRIQNKALSDLVMNMAKASGQTPKTLEEAQAILNEGLTKVVSKNRNIPEDVLREMEEDKRALAELKQTQAKQRALAGFQLVKDTHGLSKDEVNTFADKLIEKNINPFEQEVDLVKEYRNIYFDELIVKAKEAGVQEERARSLKAQNNSTTPSTQKGLPENTGSQGNPIKSVADLDKLLEGLK